jgi:hypothetical protein
MFLKFTNVELLQAKELTDKLRQLEKPNVKQLTPELLVNLCDNFIRGLEFFNNPDELFEKPFSGACGCMGPQDGDLFCGCVMRNLQYEYRYDIALKLVEDLE